MSEPTVQPRFSASRARTHFAELMKTAQTTPVEITSDDQPVAFVVGHERFAKLRAQSIEVQADLRKADAEPLLGTPEQQLAQLRLRLHEVLATHFPRPKLTLADILARVDGPVPIDQEFLSAPQVGNEVI
jgi:prevent-host-death family protein